MNDTAPPFTAARRGPLHRFASPLVRHDLLVSGRALSRIFSRWRDRLLLLLALPFLVAFAIGNGAIVLDYARAMDDSTTSLVVLVAAGMLFSVGWMRVRWHRDRGVLAPRALVPAVAAIHVAAPMAVALLVLLGTLAWLNGRLWGLAAGTALAAVELTCAEILLPIVWRAIRRRAFVRRRRRSPEVLGSRAMRACTITARVTGLSWFGLAGNCAVFAGLGFAFAALFAMARAAAVPPVPAEATAGVLAFCALMVLPARLPQSMPRFLSALGVSPFWASAAITAMGGSMTFAMALGLALADPHEASTMAAVLIGMTALFGGFGLLLVCHQTLRAPGAAGTAVQMDLIALAFVASLAVPVAALGGMVRVALLMRAVGRKARLFP